jgi:predicted PurR-regulated permease PerM
MSTSSQRLPSPKSTEKHPRIDRADSKSEGPKDRNVIRTEPVLGSPLSVSTLILAVLAAVYALYVGKEVILPLMLALVLKLLLQPVMEFLRKRLRLPGPLAALILIICLFCGIAAVVFTISGPASGWLGKAPEVLPLLKQKLSLLRGPIDYFQSAFKELEEVATPAGPNANVPTVAVKDTSAVASAVAWSTVTIVTRLFTTMIILFFLLAAGDRLLRGLIEVLPRFSDKKQAADIASEIQRQIGGYLFTITVMNSAVGIFTGLAMWGCGLGDPILWGAAAFLLNYVPILGPLAGIGMFLLAGIVALEWPWGALLPAGIYLLIHILEGEIITPLLLAKRFTLNPVLVIVSLFFWHAVWGVPGALLAVPLLAMFKISADRLETLKPAGHIIGA